METKQTYKKWIDAAYIEFTETGPDFSLKALSEKAGLPRATFYYHFDNKANLTDELIKYHLKNIDIYCSDLRQNVRKLIPDLYELMFKHLVGVKFHRQLLMNSHVNTFKNVYYSANLQCIELLLPFIKDYFGEQYTDSELIKYYNILTDVWYTRLNFSEITVASMIEVAEDILHNLLVNSNI